MADKETSFPDHFGSKEHADRVNAASAAMIDKLQRIAQSGNENHGLLKSFSEAMGTIYGIAAYYKMLGMQHHADLIFKDAAEFVRKP